MGSPSEQGAVEQDHRKRTAGRPPERSEADRTGLQQKGTTIGELAAFRTKPQGKLHPGSTLKVKDLAGGTHSEGSSGKVMLWLDVSPRQSTT